MTGDIFDVLFGGTPVAEAKDTGNPMIDTFNTFGRRFQDAARYTGLDELRVNMIKARFDEVDQMRADVKVIGDMVEEYAVRLRADVDNWYAHVTDGAGVDQ